MEAMNMTKNSTDTLDRHETAYTAEGTGSTNTIKDPMVPEATVGERRPWAAWQDWVNIGLGIYVVLAPIWTAGAPVGWFVTLGVLAIAAGVWAGFTASSSVAEWTQMIIGTVLILSPLFGGYAAAITATWTAWIVGLALTIFAATAMYRNRSGRAETNPYDTVMA